MLVCLASAVLILFRIMMHLADEEDDKDLFLSAIWFLTFFFYMYYYTVAKRYGQICGDF